MQLFSALELTFSIDLSAEEGGGNVELLPNGRDLEVTAANVYSYVRKYSHYRWVKCLAVLRLMKYNEILSWLVHVKVIVVTQMTSAVHTYKNCTNRVPVGQALDMK